MVGGKGGLRTQARSRVWPVPACRASPGLPAVAARPTKPAGQRNAPHQACRPSRRVPPGQPAVAARPTKPASRRGASYRVHQSAPRVQLGLPAAARARNWVHRPTRCAHRACASAERVPPGLPAVAARLTVPAGQRAALQQETSLPHPLPGAFVQARRHVSDELTRPHPTYGYNRFYN